MRDPYILENGTLRNKLGITDYNELRNAEKDISYVKLMNVEEAYQEKFNINSLKKLHKHIFEDIYDWAGEFRNIQIYKTELVIPGISLQYSDPKLIDKKLNEILEQMNTYDWQNKSVDEITPVFTNFLAKIWRVHPFRDGNTRTTLAFAGAFARQHGFEMDMSTMLEHLGRIQDPETGKVIKWCIRDRFVLAALDERDYPEPQALEQVIKQAIINGGRVENNNLLKNHDER